MNFDLTESDTQDTLASVMLGGDTASLIGLLKQSDEARRAYVELMSLNAELSWEISGARAAVSPAAHRRWRIGPAMAVAAAIVMLVTAAGWWLLGPHEADRGAAGHTGRGAAVAMLTDLNHAVFADDQSQLRLGSDLPPDALRLVSGQAQVMLDRGAVVELAGPCSFEATTDNRGRLTHGTLMAIVPKQARGFTVDTPLGYRVTDLGTQFLMRIRPDGATVVHVQQGQIVIASADNAIGLTAGQGWRLSADGKVEPFRSAAIVADELSMNPLVTPEVVAASSVFRGDPNRFAVAHLFEEQAAVIGGDWAGDGSDPQWVIVDFHQRVTVRGLRFAHRRDSGDANVDRITRLELAASDSSDFADFPPIAIKPELDAAAHRYLMTPMTGRYVRVLFIGNGDPRSHPGASLIQFFGDETATEVTTDQIHSPAGRQPAESHSISGESK
ncbi:MAG: hypothetical protein GC162_15040 [Planctomycetes bacterium]|nr:hypothetical protein [Planctomycetota bacterium]